MSIGYEEHLEFRYATDAEWDRAEAYELGANDPDKAWINTDRDVWHKNPFYTGPEVPHPEDEYGWELFTNVGAHAVALYEEHLWDLEHPVIESNPDEELPF